MPLKIEQKKYRTALCPYLLLGNRRILIHMDAYCVPQSLQWPRPGAPDRLGWRNFCDEWPYWEEMTEEDICHHISYFEYADGRRDYLHHALSVEVSYIEDSNVIEGRYELPGGAVVEITAFVPPGKDVWVRRFSVKGRGRFVCRGEFWEKAVRGHSLCHLGEVSLRGFMEAEPRGVFVIMGDIPLKQEKQCVTVPVDGGMSWTVYVSFATDLAGAAGLGAAALKSGYETLKNETVAHERAWLSRAKEPLSKEPFILRNYKRWLLSNILLAAEDGVMICGPRPFWSFAWPRDCSQQALGFAAAGFTDEARRILEWNLDNTPESGVHEARYWADGSPVALDNRPRQADSAGFLCHAALLIMKSGECAWVETVKDKIYLIADRLVRGRDPETLLPLPDADHRETQIAESLSVALSAAGGLRAAAEIAMTFNDGDRRQQYLAAADEVMRGAERSLWDNDEEYFITSLKPLNRKADISVCWGAGWFRLWSPDDPKLQRGVMRVYRERWNAKAGGVLSAEGTPYASFWMYYTSILLLGMAAAGKSDAVSEILSSLERNISPQGLIPEQISLASGNLWGCAPLPPPQANLLFFAHNRW